MTARILRTEAARRDLDERAEFIQRDSPEAAIRFLDAASDAFSLLARMPELGTLCHFVSPGAAGVRVWSIKGFQNHLIFYRVVAEGVEIIRVLHAARNIDEVFGR